MMPPTGARTAWTIRNGWFGGETTSEPALADANGGSHAALDDERRRGADDEGVATVHCWIRENFPIQINGLDG
ncbi:hypothetical protein ACTZWT_05205 [Rhodopseudomonas sp. NSM]|uniref:hypothetical protein n=1 Tax=Rhodopseudomonas sp. NSM TaxID=3457630 RepID=UPI004036F001